MNEIKYEINEFMTWFRHIKEIRKPIIIREKERPFKEVQQYVVNAINFILNAVEGRKSIDCLAKDLYDNYDLWAKETNISCGKYTCCYRLLFP